MIKKETVIKLAEEEFFKGYYLRSCIAYGNVELYFDYIPKKSLLDFFNKAYSFSSYIHSFSLREIFVRRGILIKAKGDEVDIRLAFSEESHFSLKDFLKGYLLDFLNYFSDKDWEYLKICSYFDLCDFMVMNAFKRLSKTFYFNDFEDLVIQLVLCLFLFERGIQVFNVDIEKLKKSVSSSGVLDLRDIYLHLQMMYI